jgi:hypothetical protein
MSNKYLSDGRKVVVIGQINNQETIVQEIFVTKAGDEIPSGERFVVKSLHDEPVLSYKEKQAQKSEATITKINASVKTAEKERTAINAELKGLRLALKSFKATVKNLNEKDANDLIMFLSGSIQYVCVGSSYGLPEIKPFTDALVKYENSYGDRRFDSLRLMSVAGGTDGSLEYKQHAYSDNSGGWSVIIPFASHEEAVEYVANKAADLIAGGKAITKRIQAVCRAGYPSHQ